MDVSKNEVHPKTKQKTPKVNMVALSVETHGFFLGEGQHELQRTNGRLVALSNPGF